MKEVKREKEEREKTERKTRRERDVKWKMVIEVKILNGRGKEKEND